MGRHVGQLVNLSATHRAMPAILPKIDDLFERLTGHRPFPWQRRLHERFVTGEFPPCSLPTGLGKTSVIALWLLALADAPASVPRRLAYVVNRRTIVDQATREAERLRERLKHEALVGLRERIRALTGSDSDDLPLAISTLRGQFADNGEWSADPARPAIIVGTVDMIGSRLLFSGYGRGFRHRPLHAGFLGQDTLVVHDEAHLEPAFQSLLEAIVGEQTRQRDFRPLRVMPLTATPRSNGEVSSFGLTAQDYAHKDIKQRLEATKTIALHAIDDKGQTADRVAQLALARAEANPESAILVFVRRVDDVKAIVKALTKAKVAEQKVLQLTGTLRGMERDQLVATPVFQRYLAAANRESTVTPEPGTVFLVATSAGEVGVDISADHLVCDLTPFDSMAQRFGRVNRYGSGEAHIDLVYSEEVGDNGLGERYQASRARTLDLMRKLGGDGSPSALYDLPLDERLAAFSPTPRTLSATHILFDAWALTTIRDLPGRPPVADWLHGVPDEWQPPETQVGWRDEVQWITGDLRERHKPADLLEVYPLKPHEVLRDRSKRVLDELKQIASRLGPAGPDVPVWLEDDRGVQPTTLGTIIAGDERTIADRTVILPPYAGGLNGGMLDGKVAFDSDIGYDVADQWLDENGRQRRARVWDDEKPPHGMRPVGPAIDVDLGSEDDGEGVDQPEADIDREIGKANGNADGSSPPPHGQVWRWYTLPRSADDDGSRAGNEPVRLDVHVDDVTRHVERMTAALGLTNTPEGKALIPAARWHDSGKDRQVWQRSIWNDSYPERVLAKSGHRRPPRDLSAYRHEFGSLVDVTRAAEFSGLSEEAKDLMLHFIAAHHGRARPHFPAVEVFDPEHDGDGLAVQVAKEVPNRFARLQRRYGRWGLAYLESILRAADVAASVNPSKPEANS